VALPLLVFLVALGEALSLCDLLQITWGLELVTRPADRSQPVRIVRVLCLVPQSQRRAVIEDEEA